MATMEGVNHNKRQRSYGARDKEEIIKAIIKLLFFLDENKKQALGERRVGLGVMCLHDLLIYCESEYGSAEGNLLVEQVFETIATTAYRTSMELSPEAHADVQCIIQKWIDSSISKTVCI